MKARRQSLIFVSIGSRWQVFESVRDLLGAEFNVCALDMPAVRTVVAHTARRRERARIGVAREGHDRTVQRGGDIDVSIIRADRHAVGAHQPERPPQRSARGACFRQPRGLSAPVSGLRSSHATPFEALDAM